MDRLLDTLGWISFHKSMIPFGLRGWVSSLGLHVQERKAGQWTRLQAGGKFRSYLDAWKLQDEDWDIRKFHEKTWNFRFADVLRPSYEISEYLITCLGKSNSLRDQQRAVLEEAISIYKADEVWNWLPGFVVDLEGVAKEASLLSPEELKDVVNRAVRFRLGSEQPFDYVLLALLFDLSGSYLEMEVAIKESIEYATLNKTGLDRWMAWPWKRTLGILYLAAFNNSIGGNEISVLGSQPSRVNAASLNRTTEEVRDLAHNLLKETLEDMKRLDISIKLRREVFQEIEEAIAICEGN